ncbi:MAG TPA: 3-deoxy-manno-octulosonate cytidylyltransferase [Bacteroidales bacterium]|nr:3-deoxy-manno-octulosonate cytidylyltransferase [Bacteroidales bacterium]HPM93417.1 3-deoxy-manno-octulosonate cytidylyltransferase [Bacteroidales bacterium]
MNCLAIIPARYGSSRFPGKPLAMINGRSMILRVCDRVKSAGVFIDQVVATDDERILTHVLDNGYQAIMTSEDHQSGTDRCLEALETWESSPASPVEFVVNIQGDEPFIQPEQIRLLYDTLISPGTGIATLAKLIDQKEDIFNPNVVKVVFSSEYKALIFTRSPLPYVRRSGEMEWIHEQAHYKHIGIYGFRSEVLRQICRLPQGRLEKLESLEQLRWLENGFDIKLAITVLESVAIDTPADLLKITNTA